MYKRPNMSDEPIQLARGTIENIIHQPMYKFEVYEYDERKDDEVELSRSEAYKFLNEKILPPNTIIKVFIDTNYFPDITSEYYTAKINTGDGTRIIVTKEIAYSFKELADKNRMQMHSIDELVLHSLENGKSANEWYLGFDS